MTATEIAQLRNDRDAWRARALAMERKYAPLRGRSFVAVTIDRRGRRLVGETISVLDARDGVTVNNFLRDIEAALVAWCGGAEEGRSA